KGAYFTRGSGHDKHGAYTEGAAEYAEVMERIARKVEGAAEALPAPEEHGSGSAIGLLALGSPHAAVMEAVDILRERGVSVDYLRLRAFPFADAVHRFLQAHEQLFVVEQNRDAQLRSLLALETGVPRDRMNSIRDFGGFPLNADLIVDAVFAATGAHVT